MCGKRKAEEEEEPPKNKRSNRIEDGFTTRTRKFCLRKILKDERILRRIEEDCLEMSSLSYEASLLIYYNLYKRLYGGEDIEKFAALDYFYQLKANAPNKYLLDERYVSMRNGLPKYMGDGGRSNLFIALAKGYDTVFKNNIWMHAYSRVRKLLRRLNPDASSSDIRDNLKYLFTKKEDGMKGNKTLNFHFDWERWHFSQSKFRPYTYVRDFFNIQCLNESNGWKNFTLVPLFKAGRQHIQYDRRSFCGMLSSIGLLPKKLNDKGKLVNIDEKELNWNDFIDLPDNFDKSFTTDGVTVCVHVKTEHSTRSEKRQQQARVNFDSYIGMDPGQRVFVAAVKEMKGRRGHMNYKISNATYQYENGAHIRKQKRLKWTGKLNEIIERDRQTYDVDISSVATSNYESYVSFQLKWLVHKQVIHCQKKVARLKFDEYRRKHATICKYVKRLVRNSGKVAVMFGDASVAPNSPIKGYVRVPGKLLRSKLENHPRVTLVPIDEFNTSQICSICRERVIQLPLPAPGVSHAKRFTSCPSCGVVFHRDINAANNMLRLGLIQLEGGERPLQFARNTRNG